MAIIDIKTRLIFVHTGLGRVLLQRLPLAYAEIVVVWPGNIALDEGVYVLSAKIFGVKVVYLFQWRGLISFATAFQRRHVKGVCIHFISGLALYYAFYFFIKKISIFAASIGRGKNTLTPKLNVLGPNNL
jgi:hypothetical protein